MHLTYYNFIAEVCETKENTNLSFHVILTQEKFPNNFINKDVQTLTLTVVILIVQRQFIILQLTLLLNLNLYNNNS